MTRAVGIVLIVVAVGICLIGSALLGTGVAQGGLELAGAILGFGLLFVFLVAPLAGGGILALAHGHREKKEQEESEALKRLLDIVKTRGRVNISDLAIELKTDLSTVQGMIYGLVGLGVFNGYINWDEGVLYSSDASALREMTQCKHCGGNLSLAGKGVLKCPFCGTEYFLS
jgi:hypothetical protein